MSEPLSPLILVTGATGFVGRHLCVELAQRGFRIRGTHRGWHPEICGVEWVDIGDIGPRTNWTTALLGVTHILHLAAVAHKVGVKGQEIQRAFKSVNVEGTRCLVEATVSSGIPGRFCHVSSGGAVCTLSETLITDQTPCRPDSAYGRSKLESEKIVQDILGSAGKSWTIVRPTLVYGPGNPGNMARLLRLVRLGVPLPFGGIQNRRSFVFVGNLVDALIRCMEHPGADCEILAINDGVVVSTPELVRIISRVSGQRVRLFGLPLGILRLLARLGDLPKAMIGRSVGLDTYSLERLVGSHYMDASRAFAKLQWLPPNTMEEGLALTLAAELNSRKGVN